MYAVAASVANTLDFHHNSPENFTVLCPGTSYPLYFRFLPHGCDRGRRCDVHGNDNKHLRQDVAWLENYNVLFEYHNDKIYLFNSRCLAAIYPKTTPFGSVKMTTHTVHFIKYYRLPLRTSPTAKLVLEPTNIVYKRLIAPSRLYYIL